MEVTAGAKSEVSWSLVQKTIHRENYSLLYLAKNQFIYVPYDSFENNADKEYFKALCDQKTSPNS